MRLKALIPILPIGFNLLFPVAISQSTTFQPFGISFKSPVTVLAGLKASVVFSNLTTPRGITFDGENNLLVVERGLGLSAFHPSIDNKGSVGWERTLVINNPNFTQGVQVDGEVLYVSTATDTLAYQYDVNTRSIAGGVDGKPWWSVVSGIPGDGGAYASLTLQRELIYISELTTHTLQLERDLTRSIALLIANGPKTNIDETARDPASGRSQIRRFPLASPITFPISPPTQNWDDGQVIAFGIRNPAGFAFLPSSSNLIHEASAHLKALLVVENGASIDGTSNLTSTFVNDNPADELELVTFSSSIPTNESTHSAPQSYGFPDCTTLWNPVADPIGNPQFADKKRGDQFSLQLDPTRGDDFCSNSKNNQPPVISFQAHSVPLDIKFYDPSFGLLSSGSLPSSFRNRFFVSFHGSFNRNPPTGYGVVM